VRAIEGTFSVIKWDVLKLNCCSAVILISQKMFVYIGITWKLVLGDIYSFNFATHCFDVVMNCFDVSSNMDVFFKKCYKVTVGALIVSDLVMHSLHVFCKVACKGCQVLSNIEDTFYL
jgi:hypothetical protein